MPLKFPIGFGRPKSSNSSPPPLLYPSSPPPPLPPPLPPFHYSPHVKPPLSADHLGPSTKSFQEHSNASLQHTPCLASSSFSSPPDHHHINHPNLNNLDFTTADSPSPDLCHSSPTYTSHLTGHRASASSQVPSTSSTSSSCNSSHPPTLPSQHFQHNHHLSNSTSSDNLFASFSSPNKPLPVPPPAPLSSSSQPAPSSGSWKNFAKYLLPDGELFSSRLSVELPQPLPTSAPSSDSSRIPTRLSMFFPNTSKSPPLTSFSDNDTSAQTTSIPSSSYSNHSPPQGTSPSDLLHTTNFPVSEQREQVSHATQPVHQTVTRLRDKSPLTCEISPYLSVEGPHDDMEENLFDSLTPPSDANPYPHTSTSTEVYPEEVDTRDQDAPPSPEGGSSQHSLQNDTNLFEAISAMKLVEVNKTEISPRISRIHASSRVMTAQEFEAYKKHKEQISLRRLNRKAESSVNEDPNSAFVNAIIDGSEANDSNSNENSDTEPNYEDNSDIEDDDLTRARQATLQRRKQEAHLITFRQAMRRSTAFKSSFDSVSSKGSRSSDLAAGSRRSSDSAMPNGVFRDDFSRSGIPKMIIGEEDEDENVPLAVLRDQGFSRRSHIYTNRLGVPSMPPRHYMSSSLDLRRGNHMSMLSPGNRDSLPVFARNLPVDPYLSAGFDSDRDRRNFSGYGPPRPGSVFGAAESVYNGDISGYTPPGGLVGVIDAEERAKAWRRDLSGSHGPSHYGNGMMTNPPIMPMGMPAPPSFDGMNNPGMQNSMSKFIDAVNRQSEMFAAVLAMQNQQHQQFDPNGVPLNGGGMNESMLSLLPTPPSSQAGFMRPQSTYNGITPNGSGQLPLRNRAMSMMFSSTSSSSSIRNGQVNQGNRFASSGYAATSNAPISSRMSMYAPSIAPSVRSTVGQASRYRSVSQTPVLNIGASPMKIRAYGGKNLGLPHRSSMVNLSSMTDFSPVGPADIGSFGSSVDMSRLNGMGNGRHSAMLGGSFSSTNLVGMGGNSLDNRLNSKGNATVGDGNNLDKDEEGWKDLRQRQLRKSTRQSASPLGSGEKLASDGASLSLTTNHLPLISLRENRAVTDESASGSTTSVGTGHTDSSSELTQSSCESSSTSTTMSKPMNPIYKGNKVENNTPVKGTSGRFLESTASTLLSPFSKHKLPDSEVARRGGEGQPAVSAGKSDSVAGAGDKFHVKKGSGKKDLGMEDEIRRLWKGVRRLQQT